LGRHKGGIPTYNPLLNCLLQSKCIWNGAYCLYNWNGIIFYEVNQFRKVICIAPLGLFKAFLSFPDLHQSINDNTSAFLSQFLKFYFILYAIIDKVSQNNGYQKQNN